MAEPIDLPTAKLYLRLAGSGEDTLVTSLIVAAREWVESFTGHILVQRIVTDVFDRFVDPVPAQWPNVSYKLELTGWPIDPAAAVTINYLDVNGAAAVLAGYRLLTAARPAALTPAIGAIWPRVYGAVEAVSVSVMAGYATADLVPQRAKSAMLVILASMYADREGGPTAEAELAAGKLCRGLRLWSL